MLEKCDLNLVKCLTKQGGFLTVPFEMKFPNGELMPKTEDSDTMVQF